MRKGADYPKVVEWSTEDRCFVGSCPGLFYGGCHGSDEKKVFAELCRLVDETIELYRKDGKPLPPPIRITNLTRKKLTLA
jgi:predicted RNase H-like HicB family nuclease